jgi:hypothetical protein
MKKITLLTAIAMIAFTVNSFAQESATGSSTTTVIAPITITAGNALAFGNVTEDGTGGTVTVTAAASATATGATGAQAVDGTVTAGAFNVGGETGNVYTITLPSTTTTLNGASAGAPTIAVSGLNTNITEGTIGTDITFYVGGIITLTGGKVVDSYSGTYTATVQYL